MDAQTDRREMELIKRARHGDEDALGVLVDTHSRALIGYITRMVGDFHQAEDLAQETFLRAFDNLDSFDPRRPFRPWLLRIGRNLTLNYLQSRTARERKGQGDVSERWDVGTDDTPEDMLAKDERRRGVEMIMGHLPVHFREVLHLRYMEGLEYEAIANQLDLPMGTVKTWLHRAKKAFLSKAEGVGLEF